MSDLNYNIAYNHIRKQILDGVYPAGFRLQSKQLSEETAHSRTTIREALRQLEVDGLVSIQPRLGARVKMMDIDELSDLCDLRLALESHAAGLAAQKRTSSELDELEMAVGQMQNLTKQILQGETIQLDLVHELKKEDVRFHLGIITASKNKLIKKEILRFHLINRIVTYGSPTNKFRTAEIQHEESRYKAWMVSHNAIFKSIKDQDSNAARNEMQCHIQAIIDNSMRDIRHAGKDRKSKKLTEEESIYLNQ